jgi:hypothetical protein
MVSIDKPRSGTCGRNLELLTIEPGVHDNYSGTYQKWLKSPIKIMMGIGTPNSKSGVATVRAIH